MRLAIVGAGIAGLAAAHRLRTKWPGLDVVLFEETETLGGRATSRRRHEATFDDGAQYLKTPTEELRRFVAEQLGHATLVDIGHPVWVFDGAGMITPGDPEQNADPKWTYRDGLARLGEELAAGLEVRRGRRVDRLGRAPEGYRLFDQDGGALAQSEAVLLTPPAPQTADLLARSDLEAAWRDELIAELSRVAYRPCLSVTLGYPRPPREQPFYALVNSDRRHPISWLAYEHMKPGRGMAGQGVVIVQMAPGWSRERWNDGSEALAQRVAEQASTLLGEELLRPVWWDIRRWRYALPDGGCDAERLHAGAGLFFAGDYLVGQGRVHLALESGWAAAARIAAWGLAKSGR